MNTGSRIGVATALGLAAALLGGLIGFGVARIAVEHFEIVEGPPAGVLLVLLVGIGAVLGGVLGFALSLRWHGVAP
jgi:hypothetical protein